MKTTLMKPLFLSAFCFLLSALSSVAQSRTPVMAGTNGLILAPHHLAVTNWDGGDPWLWTFYGTSPNTVARRGDVVLKYNGPSDGQIATNLMAIGETNQTTLDVKGIVQFFGGTDGEEQMTFSSTGIDITGDDDVGIAALSFNSQNALTANPANHRLLIGNGSGFTNLYLGLTTPLYWDDLVGGYPDFLGMTWGKPELPWSNTYSFSYFGTNFHPQMATASRLAALDSKTNLTNSVFSDADIAALQAATNGVFVRIQSGTMNNVTSTNGNFISPTNQPSASNQVALTVNGVVGQTNNLVEWGTNGVRRGRIESAGHLISDGYVASTNGLINTNIAGHFWRTENLGNGFTWSLDFDGSTMISVNNSANINASSISMNGSTLSDSSRNIKGTSIALGTATALGKAHVTNSTAQIGLLIQTIATNSLAQFTTGNTLKAVVETNGFGSYNSSATNAIAASGWTNTSGAQQTALVTVTAVSFTVLDRAAATLYTSPTLTTTLSIPLQPGWAINAASGLSGTILPW